MNRSGVALVILTHQRRARVLRTLERALSLPDAPEIVVVDNASTDGTAEMLQRLAAPVQVIRSPMNLGAAGRNLGAAATECPVVAFCDDDVDWRPGALLRGADFFDMCPELALVSGHVRVGLSGREDSACRRMATSPLADAASGGDAAGLPPGAIPIVGFLAGACMVRRRAFLSVGGFDARLFLGGEEALLALDLLAAGWQLAYVPWLEARHDPSPRRDVPLRRRLLRRNAARVAWMRRPWRRALAITLAQVRASEDAGEAVRLLASLATAMPWMLRERRVVPRETERALRRVETAESTR